MASFVCKLSGLIALTAVLGVSVDAGLGTLLADPVSWRLEWPRTDFSKHSVPFEGIKSGGPPKDGISAIDAPRFERHARSEEHTSELQSHSDLVCRLLLEKKKKQKP